MFLVDGFSTIVTLPLIPFPGTFLLEREVQPPEADGGGEIETTTMRNVRVRTRASKSLFHLNTLTMQCQYDPFFYFIYTTVVNIRQLITVTFPDTATLGFWGAVDKFTPTSHKEGEFPIAEVKIIPHLRSTAGAETVWVTAAGLFAGLVNR